MTRALVTQLVEALDAMYSEGLRLGWHAHPHWSTGMANTNAATTAAREYLATEPSGERAEVLAELRLACTDGTLDATLLNKAAQRIKVLKVVHHE